jgi:hypothetical protein
VAIASIPIYWRRQIMLEEQRHQDAPRQRCRLAECTASIPVMQNNG